MPWPKARLALLIASGLCFQVFYGGFVSLSVVLVLTAIAYIAGRTKNRIVVGIAIAASVLTLLYFKYMVFLANSLLAMFLPSDVIIAIGTLTPAVIPLGISFFTFEFVHYLVDVYRGDTPVRSGRDFAGFILFWPTMVAGPIKRYQQFIPALHQGIKIRSSSDTMRGLIRIAIGFIKKWAADNLTGWISYIEPQLGEQSLGSRWLFLAALSARILLDFSGYSDMAIGYARIMGITVPENFNWPYVARSPIEFWQRWHMSLSLWIRDYIYIPLGGNRLGIPRRILNALAAMTICGLWHGAAWNFAIWGLYHGFGLAVTTGVQRGFPRVEGRVVSAFSWIVTMIFVSVGWLLFFYPVEHALTIMKMLVGETP
jgi:alginate O-acetyltransferase complex protein AlgI